MGFSARNHLIFSINLFVLMNRQFLSVVFCCVLCCSCKNNEKQKDDDAATATSAPAAINYSVVARHPHDTTSFTEGLLLHKGQLFESTGHADSYASSRSLFGITDTVSGKIAAKMEIDKEKYFGEGIVFLNDRIYQLTLDTKIGFIYDAATYKKLGEFHIDGEGWGLTTNGAQLIMSNGSSNIIYLDPVSFKTVKTLNVTDNNGPVSDINELEIINGFIYANKWLTDYVLKIDTASGKVVGRLDLSALKAAAKAVYPGSIETNGIAFDTASNKIYVTGKLWPYLYEIKFSH